MMRFFRFFLRYLGFLVIAIGRGTGLLASCVPSAGPTVNPTKTVRYDLHPGGPGIDDSSTAAHFSAKLIQIQALRKRRKRRFAVRIEISQFDQPDRSLWRRSSAGRMSITVLSRDWT
jgi:hypothetical protein